MKQLMIGYMLLGMTTASQALIEITVNSSVASDTLEIQAGSSLSLGVSVSGAEDQVPLVLGIDGPGIVDVYGTLYPDNYTRPLQYVHVDSEGNYLDALLREEQETVYNGTAYTMSKGIILDLGSVLGYDQSIHLDPIIPVIPQPDLPVGLIFDDLMFHCLEQGTVTVTLNEVVGSSTLEALDQLVITQVPEPGTIALLGLGGLFLRRLR